MGACRLLAQEPTGRGSKTCKCGIIRSRFGGRSQFASPRSKRDEILWFDGQAFLFGGLLVSAAGLYFGIRIYRELKALPVHHSMREVSELIYETCKTYLINQGKFLAILWLIIALVIVMYLGWLSGKSPGVVAIIVGFSVVGILGSYIVAWFGIRVNTFANSRTAFASLRGLPYPVYAIPLKAGMSIGMMLISVELLIMLLILLVVPRDYAGACFVGFAIGESLGAAALVCRWYLYQDRRHRLGLDEDRIQNQRG